MSEWARNRQNKSKNVKAAKPGVTLLNEHNLQLVDPAERKRLLSCVALASDFVCFFVEEGHWDRRQLER